MLTMPLLYKSGELVQVCAHEPSLESVASTEGVPSNQKVHPPHSAICVRVGAGAVLVETTQALSDVLPAGEVVPEGQDEQLVAPGDVE